MPKGLLISVFSLVALSPFHGLYADTTSAFEISGFITTGVTQGDNKEDIAYRNGLAVHELNLSGYDNRIGIQIKAPVDEDMSVTALFLARGGSSNYNFTTEWAYIDYSLSERFSVHLGKYKIPQFLVSDYADVGYAYPWVRPPQDVYATNPLVSLSGLQLFYKYPMGRNSMLFQVFYGAGDHDIFLPARSIDFSPTPEPDRPAKDLQQTITTNDTTGANLSLALGAINFRLSYFETALSADFGQVTIEDAEGSFSSLGFNTDWHDIVTYAEMVSRDTDSKKLQVFPDQKAWYFTLGYRFGPVLPTITYSEIDQGKDPSPLAMIQTTIAIGMRIEINSGSAIKMEALEATPEPGAPGEPGNHGLFDSPIESGKVYTLTFDAVF